MGKKKKKQKKVLKKEIVLKIAKKKDVIELDRYKQGGKKVWKLLHGIPYWLINSKGEIENKHYILDEHTDPEEFGEFLIREQVLIPA